MKFDDYMSPFYAWDDIKHLIPRDKVIWEAFYGDGESGKFLTELGFRVIHEDIDFFNNDKGDVIVSNPPFSLIPDILNRMVDIQKPFILIMPSSKINTQYFRKFQQSQQDNIQIIIPKKRIHFKKLVDGKPVENWKNACYFDCFYYCWKIGLANDITWL